MSESDGDDYEASGRLESPIPEVEDPYEDLQRNAQSNNAASGSAQPEPEDTDMIRPEAQDSGTIQRIKEKRIAWDQLVPPGCLYWLKLQQSLYRYPAWPVWDIEDTPLTNRVKITQKEREDPNVKLYQYIHNVKRREHAIAYILKDRVAPFIPLPVLEIYLNNKELRKQWSDCFQTNLAYHALGKEVKSSREYPKEQLLDLARKRRAIGREKASNTGYKPVSHTALHPILNRDVPGPIYKLWVDAIMYSEYIWFQTEKRKYEDQGYVVEPGNTETEVWIIAGKSKQKYRYGFNELLDAEKYMYTSGDPQSSSSQESSPTPMHTSSGEEVVTTSTSPVTGAKRDRE
eukprot:gb/GECG01016244.1/.p1 GENE.gb/GECG01016244.1/~~gb/GECG01016244.1/.p1  ORF type:complete len:345 (+),score=46.77 gb/GECG01016244.1/:1-1035(+)